MISVKKAISIIESKSIKLSKEKIDLPNSLGYSLAEDVISKINMPPFDQSAMDGYAIAMHKNSEYKLIGKIKAGQNSSLKLHPGECARIFTGAKVPPGSDCVVKQEITDITKENTIYIKDSISKFDNIRFKGEQIKIGQKAIKKGTYINTGTIGFAATLGKAELSVYSKPKVKIIATGSELISPGTKLTEGSIYESNTFTLKAALNTSNFNSISIEKVEDNYENTKNKIQNAINDNDVILITGGISVGEYDFVKEILAEIGVNEGFYKIKQKPGKPMFFGYKKEKLIFALPGNPASALTCFYSYVLPALNFMSGRSDYQLEKRVLTLQSSYKKNIKMTHFLKGLAINDGVSILKKQSSAMLSPFINGNCLIIFEENREQWKAGDKVEALILPQ